MTVEPLITIYDKTDKEVSGRLGGIKPSPGGFGITLTVNNGVAHSYFVPFKMNKATFETIYLSASRQGHLFLDMQNEAAVLLKYKTALDKAHAAALAKQEKQVAKGGERNPDAIPAEAPASVEKPVLSPHRVKEPSARLKSIMHQSSVNQAAAAFVGPPVPAHLVAAIAKDAHNETETVVVGASGPTLPVTVMDPVALVAASASLRAAAPQAMSGNNGDHHAEGPAGAAEVTVLVASSGLPATGLPDLNELHPVPGAQHH